MPVSGDFRRGGRMKRPKCELSSKGKVTKLFQTSNFFYLCMRVIRTCARVAAPFPPPIAPFSNPQPPLSLPSVAILLLNTPLFLFSFFSSLPPCLPFFLPQHLTSVLIKSCCQLGPFPSDPHKSTFTGSQLSQQTIWRRRQWRAAGRKNTRTWWLIWTTNRHLVRNEDRDRGTL